MFGAPEAAAALAAVERSPHPDQVTSQRTKL